MAATAVPEETKVAATAMTQELPAGWAQLATEDGTPYFLFEPDGTTQWERPEAQDMAGGAPDEPLSPSVEKEPRVDSPEDEDPAAGEFSKVVDSLRTVEEEDGGLVTVESEIEEPSDLPPGWVALQGEDGTPYYFNRIDNKTSWERPVAEEEVAEEDHGQTFPAEESAPEMETEPLPDQQPNDVEEEEETTKELPDGWSQLATDDGTPYFFFERDGTTQWEHPGANKTTTRTIMNLVSPMKLRSRWWKRSQQHHPLKKKKRHHSDRYQRDGFSVKPTTELRTSCLNPMERLSGSILLYQYR